MKHIFINFLSEIVALDNASSQMHAVKFSKSKFNAEKSVQGIRICPKFEN